jgi:hypothetical protein
MVAARVTGARENILAQRAGKAANRMPKLDGAAILAETEHYFRRFLILPSADHFAALVLWAAHTHALDAFETTPRLLITSAEPGSGKTRVTELLATVCPRAIEAVNVSPSFLFRKVQDDEGKPTIMFDEIDTVFGPKAKDNEEIRGFLNAGHRRGAMFGRCVTNGKRIETEEIEAFAAVAMAGLGYVPDTIASRSIQFRMHRRAPGETIEPFRRRLNEPEGAALKGDLAAWGAEIEAQCATSFPAMPEGVADRDADVWEPLIVIADMAGGEWPVRARVAAVALVAESKRKAPSLGVRLLADIRKVFGEDEQQTTEDLLAALRGLDEAPWSDMKGKPIDARALSRLLSDYDIKPTTVRIGSSTLRGYRRTMFHEAWLRYLSEPSEEPATSATSATEQADGDWHLDPFGAL